MLNNSLPPNQGCNMPPEGWWCSRSPGHEGPCAARPTADPEKDFEKLIDEIESFAKVLGRVEFCWERDENVPTYQMEEAQKDFSAARQSLVDYVGGIRKELRFASRSALLLDNQFKEVCAELASLRDQLTPDEAGVLLADPLKDYTNRQRDMLRTSAREKLRRISSANPVEK